MEVSWEVVVRQSRYGSWLGDEEIWVYQGQGMLGGNWRMSEGWTNEGSDDGVWKGRRKGIGLQHED